MRTFSIGQKITTAIILLSAAIPAFAQDKLTRIGGQLNTTVTFQEPLTVNRDYREEYRPAGQGLVDMDTVALPTGANFVVDAVELIGCSQEADGTPICHWVVRVSNFGLDSAPASTMNVVRQGTWDNSITELPTILGFGTAYSNSFMTRGYDPYIEVWFDIHNTVAESVEDDNIVPMTLYVP